MFDNDTLTAIKSVAQKYSYPLPELLALMDVESAGKPFWNVNGQSKPPIRFEGHYFYQRLKGDELTKAISEGLASPKAGKVPNPSTFEARYAMLAKAEAINKDAADESTSWGLGQVMGTNWKILGYDNVQAFVDSNNTAEGQVYNIVKYLEVNNLKDDLLNHNWNAVAAGYNGKGNVSAYSKKLSDAYNKYSDDTSSYDAIASDDIMMMQKMLNAVGKYNLPTNGQLDDNTKVALRDFQLRNGLKVDGVYGPITRTSLQAAYLKVVNDRTKTIGISTTTAAGIGAAASTAAQQIQPFTTVSKIAEYVFIFLTVIGVLVVAYTAFKRKKDDPNAG